MQQKKGFPNDGRHEQAVPQLRQCQCDIASTVFVQHMSALCRSALCPAGPDLVVLVDAGIE